MRASLNRRVPIFSRATAGHAERQSLPERRPLPRPPQGDAGRAGHEAYVTVQVPEEGLRWQAFVDEGGTPAPDNGAASMRNAQRAAQAPRQREEKVWKPTSLSRGRMSQQLDNFFSAHGTVSSSSSVLAALSRFPVTRLRDCAETWGRSTPGRSWNQASDAEAGQHRRAVSAENSRFLASAFLST